MKGSGIQGMTLIPKMESTEALKHNETQPERLKFRSHVLNWQFGLV